MDAKEYGQYIKGLRLESGLTLSELGKEVGYSNPYLSQIENGHKGIPSPDLLLKFSKVLNVEYIELMYKAGYLDKDTYEKSTSLKTEIQSHEDIIKKRRMEQVHHSHELHLLQKKINELGEITDDSINKDELLRLEDEFDKLRNQIMTTEVEMYRHNEILTKSTKEYEEMISLYKTLDKTSDKSKKEEIKQLIFDKEKLLKFIESATPESNYEIPQYDNDITNEDEFLLSLFKVNEDAFINDIPTPVFVDENNNINIEIHKGCSYLNDKDTEELNSMIKGFLYNKKFLPYDE